MRTPHLCRSKRLGLSMCALVLLTLLALAAAPAIAGTPASVLAAPARLAQPGPGDEAPPALTQGIADWLQRAHPGVEYLGACDPSRTSDLGRVGLCSVVSLLSDDVALVNLAAPFSEGAGRVIFIRSGEDWAELLELTSCAGGAETPNPAASITLTVNGRSYGPFTVNNCAAL